jgi:transposase-like protein
LLHPAVSMIVTAVLCPHCQKPDSVVKHGTNRGGSARCRCTACRRSFTPAPSPRRTSEQTRQAVGRALAERMSQRAIARCFRVSFQTIRKVAQEAEKNAPPSGTV